MADKIYFHVNKKPSNPPPNSPDIEFMKEGQLIKFGDDENSFFRHLKNEIPFKFNDSESFPETASFIEFLDNLKEGKYNNHPKAPEILWYPLMVYLKCLSEQVLESIRSKEFHTLPSRQRCLWLVETREEAMDWAAITAAGNKFQIVRVRVEGNVFKCNASILDYKNESLSDMEETARSYWLGKPPFTQKEFLFEGEATVIEVL